MGCLLHKSTKFYNNVFLFVGLTTLATFTEFDWFIKLSVQTFQPTKFYSTEGLILCVIIKEYINLSSIVLSL